MWKKKVEQYFGRRSMPPPSFRIPPPRGPRTAAMLSPAWQALTTQPCSTSAGDASGAKHSCEALGR